MYRYILYIFIVVSLISSCKNEAHPHNEMVDEHHDHDGHDHDHDHGQKTVAKIKDTTLRQADQMPRFPGCEEMKVTEEEKQMCSFNLLMEYIQKNMTYPNPKIDGTVGAEFTITKEGSIDNIAIVKSLHPDYDKVVKEVLQSMNQLPIKWKAGVNKGETVAVRLQLPVRFKSE